MKLQLDLLKHLTADDIASEAGVNVHRSKPEPLFSQTGTGSLSPASTSERAREEQHRTDLIRKLEQRARQSGSKTATEN